MGSHKKFDSSSEDSSDEDVKRSSSKTTDKCDRKKKSSANSQTSSQDSDHELPKKKVKREEESSHDSRKEKHTEERRRDKDRDYKHRDERSDESHKKYDTERDRQRERRDYRGRRDDYDRRGDRYNTNERVDIRKHDGNRDRLRKPEKRDAALSQEEIAKQRKMLWCKAKPSNNSAEANQTASSNVANPEDKKAAVWTSSITAAGVGGQQANKFLKLMGIKNAPAATANVANADLQKEHDRQQKMMSDLDKQYQIARESTHTGRGMGLGFH